MDLCRQSRRGLNEHYLEQCSVRLHLAHSDRLSPADLLQGGMLQYSTISLFLYYRGTMAKKDQVVFCRTCSDRCENSVFMLSVLSYLQVFAFDHCFWSMDESNVPKYAGESSVLWNWSFTHRWRSQIMSSVKTRWSLCSRSAGELPTWWKTVFASCKAKHGLCLWLFASRVNPSSLYIVSKQYNNYMVLCRTAAIGTLDFQVHNFILGLLLVSKL